MLLLLPPGVCVRREVGGEVLFSRFEDIFIGVWLSRTLGCHRRRRRLRCKRRKRWWGRYNRRRRCRWGGFGRKARNEEQVCCGRCCGDGGRRRNVLVLPRLLPIVHRQRSGCRTRLLTMWSASDSSLWRVIPLLPVVIHLPSCDTLVWRACRKGGRTHTGPMASIQLVHRQSIRDFLLDS